MRWGAVPPQRLGQSAAQVIRRTLTVRVTGTVCVTVVMRTRTPLRVIVRVLRRVAIGDRLPRRKQPLGGRTRAFQSHGPVGAG